LPQRVRERDPVSDRRHFPKREATDYIVFVQIPKFVSVFCNLHCDPMQRLQDTRVHLFPYGLDGPPFRGRL